MKISINLLPPEILRNEVKTQNFYKIQFIGIAIILTMVFLASLSVALGVLQSNNISAAQEELTRTEGQVADLKGKEDSLLLIKNRLAVINKYMGVSSESSAMYKLLEVLMPPSVIVNAVTINKTGEIIIVATLPDYLSVDELINSFTQKDLNEGKTGRIFIENLSRGRDGFYRINFKIKYS